MSNEAQIIACTVTVKNGMLQIAEIKVIRSEEILRTERESLQRGHRSLQRLPQGEADLLTGETIGKDISGTRMETK